MVSESRNCHAVGCLIGINYPLILKMKPFQDACYISTLIKYNERDGTRISNVICRKSAARNGKIPFQTVSSSIPMSLATPAIMKVFIPIGGVIMAISAILTKIIPNHIGLNPRLTIKGKNMGMVRKVIAATSRKQPRKK